MLVIINWLELALLIELIKCAGIIANAVIEADNEQGELGVVRVVGLIVVGLVMLLAFIYMTTTE